MEIIFSTAFNSSCFVDYSLVENKTSFYKKIVGELGLLELLEREFGLTGVYSTAIERTTYYCAALAKYCAQNKDAFYSAAFAIDDMGVAKDLLQERDKLVMIGWQQLEPESQSSRLKALAEVELHFINRKFHFGISDRWQAILQALEKDNLAIKWKITVVENPELMHPFFRKLFQKVSPGVKFKDLNKEIVCDDTNLGKVKRLLLGKMEGDSTFSPLSADNTFAVLRLKDNYQAAEVLCNQIKQGFEPVIINAENALLDYYLVANGLPATGSMLNNSNPFIVQLFKLVSVSLVSPLNVYNLLSLLQSPYSPLPKRLSAKLARQLIKEPGVDGVNWKTLIDEYFENYAFENPDKNKQKKKREDVEMFLTFNDTAAIHTAKVKSIYATLQCWSDLQKIDVNHRYSDGERMQFAHLSILSKALLNKLNDITTTEIEGPVLLKWIESIYEPANFNNETTQVASVNSVSDPANLLNDAPIVWWCDAYNDTITAKSHSFLYANERADLRNSGLDLYEPANEINCQWEKAKRGILAAQKQCILVVVEKHNGEEIKQHPIVSEIKARFRNFNSIRATEVNLETLTGKQLLRVMAQEMDLPKVEERWKINNADKLRKRKVESASSIEKLIHHPFEWVMKYQAQLSTGNAFTLPELKLLKGTIAHAVTEAILNKKATLGYQFQLGDEIIKAVFDNVINEQGLLFLLPEMRFEYEVFLLKYRETIKILLELIDQNSLEFKGCEVKKQTDILGLGNIEGFVDLLLVDKTGNDVVIDLKWTKNTKSYQTKLEEGKAIQLALYASMVGNQPRTAYYLLENQCLCSLHPFRGENVKQTNGITEHEVINKAINSVAYRWEELAKGVIEIGDGQLLDEINYHLATDERNMIPLDNYNKLKSTDRFSGLELFKGEIS